MGEIIDKVKGKAKQVEGILTGDKARQQEGELDEALGSCGQCTPGHVNARLRGSKRSPAAPTELPVNDLPGQDDVGARLLHRRRGFCGDREAEVAQRGHGLQFSIEILADAESAQILGFGPGSGRQSPDDKGGRSGRNLFWLCEMFDADLQLGVSIVTRKRLHRA
jgi:hypothetical protein